jgi:enamine deaminase RidA (YjgF/YER057c/UK114 family)
MSNAAFSFLQPDGWAPPQGYANGIAAPGRQIYVAGQIGWNAQGRLVGDDFAAQVEQALRNVVAVLAAGGAGPEHIVRMNWYVTDKDAYVAARKAIGESYRAVIGRHFPTMTLLVVAGLLEPGAKVEIEATAVVPTA